MGRRAGEPADPDDDLARELREIAAGRAAQPLFIEPSAAERARRKSVTRANLPARRRRRATLADKALGLLVLAVILSGSAYLLITKAGIGPRQTLGMSAPLAEPAFTTADPFGGTPADGWADDAAGIVPPVSRSIGGFSAVQVRAAYQATRRLLIAAHLNPLTLAGGPPTAFADLLAPQLRRYFLSTLRTSRAWVTSFAPGTTELVGPVIKVHGYMRALTAYDGGHYVLRVHADYVFAYAVQRPGQPRSRMRIVDQDVVNVDFAPWNGPGWTLAAWWRPTRAGGAAGARCDVHDGFVHPDFPGVIAHAPQREGAPVDPYQLNPAPFHGACQATTGT
jgi:hypothetical protein